MYTVTCTNAFCRPSLCRSACSVSTKLATWPSSSIPRIVNLMPFHSIPFQSKTHTSTHTSMSMDCYSSHRPPCSSKQRTAHPLPPWLSHLLRPPFSLPLADLPSTQSTISPPPLSLSHILPAPLPMPGAPRHKEEVKLVHVDTAVGPELQEGVHHGQDEVVRLGSHQITQQVLWRHREGGRG